MKTSLTLKELWARVATLFALFIGFAFMFLGLLWGLEFSPPDRLQGEAVRLMYVHVPFAYLSTALYMAMAAFSILYLLKKYSAFDRFAFACAIVGLGVTLVTLITGSIWARPAWGVWWVWDARLTSVVVLCLLYLSIVLIRVTLKGSSSVAAAVLSVVGAVNIPIIKLSVLWWNTLHQPPSIARNAMDQAFLTPLGLMALAFTGFVVWLVIMLAKTFKQREEIRQIKIALQLAKRGKAQ